MRNSITSPIPCKVPDVVRLRKALVSLQLEYEKLRQRLRLADAAARSGTPLLKDEEWLAMAELVVLGEQGDDPRARQAAKEVGKFLDRIGLKYRRPKKKRA